jgi:hypothetical protein
MSRSISTLALLAAAASPLMAQEPERIAPTWGLGVSLTPAALVSSSGQFIPIGLGNLYLPIYAASGLRLEPEFGLLRTSTSSGSFSNSSTSLRLGVGVFGMLRDRGPTRIYLGPRVGLIATSSGSSTSRTDMYVTGALGGEHFFGPHFSLGGEVQLQYLSLDTGGSGSSANAISTNGLVFIRIYP